MLLSINSKIKKTGKKHGKKIANFALPALKTCPNAGACRFGCYAKSGAYLFSNVAKKHEENLKATKSTDFVYLMMKEIKDRKIEIVRVHDSGDFYSLEYLQKWVAIANGSHAVLFYFYTKNVEMIKSMSLPKNVHAIFSFGGKQDHLIDHKKDRVARVFSSKKELENRGFIDASDDDLTFLRTKKIGLVYHGSKNFSATQWAIV